MPKESNIPMPCQPELHQSVHHQASHVHHCPPAVVERSNRTISGQASRLDATRAVVKIGGRRRHSFADRILGTRVKKCLRTIINHKWAIQ